MDRRIRIGSFVIAALGFSTVIAIGMGGVRTADSAGAMSEPGAAAAPDVWPYASRLLLSALLVPALELEAMPIRWVDPRPALGCGPDNELRVNGAPLIAGARVPELPFELEWQSDGCHPFGHGGPRFDGRVHLTVGREDSGLSVAVEPSDLRIAWEKNGATWPEPGTASTPLCIDRSEPDAPIVGPDVLVKCR